MRTLLTAVALVLLGPTAVAARADPAPGFDLNPAELEARMNACMAYQVDEREILMAWWNLRSGEVRQWRCSSLRHMILDDHGRGLAPHDPYIDVIAFMRCADKVVSYGFPRPATDARYVQLHYQYNGTKAVAYAIVDDATGDVASIYTEKSNDWAACANGL
jgi:hypothetical protein